MLLGRGFAALPNNRLGAPTLGFIIVNIVIDLLEGISILWLYAAIRPLYRQGAKTGNAPRTCHCDSGRRQILQGMISRCLCHNSSRNGSQGFRDLMDRVPLPAIQSRFAIIIYPNAVLPLSLAFGDEPAMRDSLNR